MAEDATDATLTCQTVLDRILAGIMAAEPPKGKQGVYWRGVRAGLMAATKAVCDQRATAHRVDAITDGIVETCTEEVAEVDKRLRVFTAGVAGSLN